MTHTAWVLTEERPGADGGTHLLLTAVPGPHPRVRHRLDADGVLRAGLVVGSVEQALSGGEPGVEDVTGGRQIALDVDGTREVAELPTADGLAAAERLQRGAEAVWEATLRDVEVRGVVDVEVDGATSLVLPLLRHTMRRITVTDDDRLVVLDEHAAQPRPEPAELRRQGDGDVGDIVRGVWARPADVVGSRIRVHTKDAVRSAYVDGGWEVTASTAEERLVLSLPLDFPAERFGDV